MAIIYFYNDRKVYLKIMFALIQRHRLFAGEIKLKFIIN